MLDHHHRTGDTAVRSRVLLRCTYGEPGSLANQLTNDIRKFSYLGKHFSHLPVVFKYIPSNHEAIHPHRLLLPSGRQC